MSKSHFVLKEQKGILKKTIHKHYPDHYNHFIKKYQSRPTFTQAISNENTGTGTIKQPMFMKYIKLGARAIKNDGGAAAGRDFSFRGMRPTR